MPAGIKSHDLQPRSPRSRELAQSATTSIEKLADAVEAQTRAPRWTGSDGATGRFLFGQHAHAAQLRRDLDSELMAP